MSLPRYVKLDYFRMIWNTCYNINSESPKVDVCTVCHIFKNRFSEALAANKECRDIQQDFEEHKNKATKAYGNLGMAKDTEIWPVDE